MTTPDPISENNPASQTLAPVPANSDSRSQKDLSLIQVSFARIAVEVASIQAHVSELQDRLSGLQTKMAAAADTVGRLDKAIVTGAPALHLYKALEKNKTVPGTKLVYMGILDHPRIGRPLNLFTAGKDFGVMKAHDAMSKLSAAENWEGHAGLALGCECGYEARVFDTWKYGRGMDQWVVMPLVVLAGWNVPGADTVFEGNLYDNRREGDLKGTLNISGGGEALWYWSCAERHDNPDYVYDVRFSDGIFGSIHRHHDRSSFRPCLARELDHLTL